MSDYQVKQVIVMRKDLNMRKGKMVAQGAHASLAAFMTADSMSEEVLTWLRDGFAKICVGIDSDIELIDLYIAAKAEGLNVALITDSGHTEFHMEPTRTCLCIGPHKNERIDPFTKELKLL
jgi:PTH2 family peptidyl-tRNA hydrolase